MALKRKRTSSPIFPKTQTHFRAEPNMHSISLSSSTSWSSISSTTSSSLSGPHTPHDGSPLSNLRYNVCLRKSIFDTRVTDDEISADAEATTIDTWRMEVDSNEHNLSNINLNVSPSGVAFQNGTNSESVMDDEPEANISGRTRKRFRDNRPAASVIHENTLKKLFNAQRIANDGPSTLPMYSQQLDPHRSHFQTNGHSEQRFNFQPSLSVSFPSTSFSLPLSTLNTSTTPSSSSTVSNLDSFLGLSSTTSTTTNNKYYNNKNEKHNTNLSLSKRPILQSMLPYIPQPPPSSSSSTTLFNSQNKYGMLSCPSPTPYVAKPACEDCDSPLLLETYSTPTTTIPTTSRGSTAIAGNAKDGMMMTMMMMDVDIASTSLGNNSNSMIDDNDDLLSQEFACRTCGCLVCDYCACVMDHRQCLACATTGGGRG